ncbi:MAG TPA: sulfatase-like hydrolase/transferase [Anaerohalosphaeraceae bacterium]|nr:sulfatase-like hydrolase/transferase [Anaerohalosphaeraceae bacterium]
MRKYTQNRREFLKAAAISAAVTGLSGYAEGLRITEGRNNKPNLLFIMPDQLRWDALSIAGNAVIQTPNIDRLARQGAYFKNAYSACAVCGPVRSTILTGHTVENTGVRNHDLVYYAEKEGLMTQPTFDEILTEQGYQCEYYGKWHSVSKHAAIYKNPFNKDKKGRSVFGPEGQSLIYRDYLDQHVPQRELKEGEFYDDISQRPYRANPMDRCYGMSNAQVKANQLQIVQPDQHGELLMDKEHTITAFQARQTMEAIERLKDKPFSITCSFQCPHTPILPTQPYYGMYPAKDMVPPASIDDAMTNSPYQAANGRKKLTEYGDKDKIKYMISDYYGIVKEVDDWVGEILKTLDKHGLTENTLVIFVSDHGEMLGSHGMREKNVFYEESSHIPLLICLPGHIKGNTTVNGYVSSLDLFATILDYLNIKEHQSNGKSLRGLIEGTDREHGNYVVTEWDFRGDVEPNYMIVKDGWKLIIPYSEKSPVLNAMYDLNTDPYEMNNLIGKNPDGRRYSEKTEELRACLLEWLKKNGSSRYEGVRKRKLV